MKGTDMRLRSALNVPVPPWGLAVTAMLSIQLGSALSVDLIEDVGPAGTAWLRLSMGASFSWRSPARRCVPSAEATCCHCSDSGSPLA